MSRQYTLRENVLTDNMVTIADEGRIFKGGYIAILEEYTYANPWNDKKHIKRFRSKERLIKYLTRYYKEIDLFELELI